MLISPHQSYFFKVHSVAFRAQKGVDSHINEELKPDIFVKKCSVPSATQRVYEKFNSELENVSTADIEKILGANTDIPRQNLLLAMEKLTEYSNIESVVKLKNKLEENNIGSVKEFYAMFENRVERVKTDNQVKYCHVIPHNQLVPLGTVFAYLFNESYPGKAKCPLDSYGKTGLVLDSHSIDYLKKVKIEDPEAFECYKKNCVPVYIENFENTYNIFEQHKDFAKESVRLAKKITLLKEKYPDKTKEEIADTLLNSKRLEEIKSLGFDPIIIKADKNQHSTPETIVKRLRAKVPSKAEFEYGIEHCLAMSGHSQDVKAKEFLLNHLEKNSYIYSFKKLSKKLTQLHELIENDVKAHGKPVDKIYYNVINAKKSYGLINYMYQKANNIPQDRFIYWDSLIKSTPEALEKILPKDATIVMIDDNIISGSAITNEDFNYRNSRDESLQKLKDYDLVFASVLSYDIAKDGLKSDAVRLGRLGKDRIISVDNAVTNENDEYNRVLSPSKLYGRDTSILFPYFTPDNNSPYLRNLFLSFFPQESFVKDSLDKEKLN